METGSLLVRQWIIINQLNWLEKYEQFDNHDAFEPIKLACSLESNILTETELTYENSLWL